MARKRSEAVRSVTSSSSAQSCRKAAEPPQTPSKPCGPRLLVKLPAMAKALAKSPRASVSAQLRDETSSKPNSSRPVGKVKAAASASVLYDSDDEPIPVPLSLAQERRLAKAAQSRLAKETPKTHRPKPTASKSPVYARQPAKIRAKERPPTPTGPGEHTPSSQASLAEVLDQVPEPEADLEVGSEASASHASQVIDQVAHNPALFPWLGSDEPPVATSTPLAKAAPAPRRRRGHSPPPKDAPPPKAPKAKAPRAMAPKATPAPAAATQARPIVPAAPAQRPPEGRPTAAALAAETGGAAEAGASEHIVDVDCLPGFRPFRVTVSGAGGPVGVSVEYLKEAGAGQATLDVFFKPTGPPKARPSTDANNNAFRNKSGFPAHAHKLIPGTKFAVDAFNNGYIGGVELYFLSHFHADHYGGLDRHFAKPILCTPMTANLAHYKLKVPAKHFRVLDIGKTYRLRDGTLVRLVDANHCPGAVLFLFLLPSGKTVLHTGDFRASPALVRAVSDELRRLQVSLDTVYLDTTYGRPEYAFPPTEAVLREVVDVVRAELRLRPNLLLVLGTYSIGARATSMLERPNVTLKICSARAGSAAVERAEAEGKEAVVLALAEALDCAVCVSAEKAELWARMGDARLLRRAATQPKGARLHLVFGKPTAKAMEEKLKASGGEWSGVLGIWPSGWEHDEARVKATVRWRGKLGHLGLPYSEHSSFQELVAAVQAWRPGKIISTVGRKADREAAEKLLATAQAAKTQTSLLSFLNNQQDRKA